MKKNNLENIVKIRFNDFSEYDSEKCNNGGCYGFWTNYDRHDNYWKVSYGTTADFPYCPCCGNFASHYDYDEECYTCGDFDTITDDELLNRINVFEENEDEYIEYIEEG